MIRSEKDRKAYAEKIKALTKKHGVPYQVCTAFRGDDKKISEFKATVISRIPKDLSDAQNSFLLNCYNKHINIDMLTGKPIDEGIAYFYEKELHDSAQRQNYALAKVFTGLTGSSIAYDEMDISALSISSKDHLALSLAQMIREGLNKALLSYAVGLIDQRHLSDLKQGVYYLSPEQKNVSNMSALSLLGIKKVVLPYGVTCVKPFAFECAGISEVILPPTITRIEEGAFLNCGLTTLTLHHNKYLTALGHEAFAGNQFTAVKIPSCIKTINLNVFIGTPLQSVVVAKDTNVINKNNIAVKTEQ